MIKKLSYKKLIVMTFLSFGLIPILPQRIIGLPVFMFIILSIPHFTIHFNKNLNFNKLLIAILPYIIFFISILYSDNFISAVKKVTETRLALLVIPFCFYLLNSEIKNIIKAQLRNLERIFIFSTFTMCCVFLLYLPFAPISDNPSFRFPSGFFFKNSLTELPLWELEPVYFSFLIVISIILTVKRYYDLRLKMVVCLMMNLVFGITLLLLVSKLAILFIGVFVIWMALSKIDRGLNKIVLILILTIVLIPISKIPSVKYEIEETVHFLKGKKRAIDDTYDKRSRITTSVIELAKNVNPFLGLGIGDTQPSLNKVYEMKNYEDLLSKKYDAHNQYLSIYLGTGLLGLMSLILYIGYNFYVSYKNKLFYMSWLIWFFAFQMLTETLLERQLPIIVVSLSTSINFFLLDEKTFKTLNV